MYLYNDATPPVVNKLFPKAHRCFKWKCRCCKTQFEIGGSVAHDSGKVKMFFCSVKCRDLWLLVPDELILGEMT